MRIRNLVLAAATAACVPRAPAPPAAPPPAAAPPGAPPRPAPLAAEWRDWPLTPGTWTYRQDARGSIALFGQAGADASLTVRCDRAARQIYLSRPGGDPRPFTIRTTSLTRAVTVQPTGGTPAYVAAALPATDPLLDAMAFSRGRFVVEQAGAPLVVPPYAEIGRAIEDCRG